MYLLPLGLLFMFSMAARALVLGELAEIILGLIGLVLGFIWTKQRLKNNKDGWLRGAWRRCVVSGAWLRGGWRQCVVNGAWWICGVLISANSPGQSGAWRGAWSCPLSFFANILSNIYQFPEPIFKLFWTHF